MQADVDYSRLAMTVLSMIGRAEIAENLFQERELAQVTLSSIGDAVVTTDISGNISYLNPVAEVMSGWTIAEAMN